MKSVAFRNVEHFDDGRWQRVDLVIDRGRIRYIGEPGTAACRGASHVFDWPDVCVLPGLINAHDHLELNLLPRMGNGPYANSYEWSRDIHHPNEPPMADVLAIPLRDRLLMGGYKNLFSGVTTVCHHNAYHARVFDRRFPVKVIKAYHWSHSLGFGERLEHAHRAAAGKMPWIIHAAEGTDRRAASEIAALEARGLLGDTTVLVHGVGMDDHDIQRVEQRRASVIWCPSSNVFLFGTTAPVDKLLDRIPVALGSDSTLSADGDLLDELRAAASRHLWPRPRLIELVTSAPARILRVDDGRGRLHCGGPADVLFIPAGAANPSEAVLAMRSRDIELVLCDGAPRYGGGRAQPIFDFARGRVSRVSVDGVIKLVSGPFNDLLRSVTRALGRTAFFGHELLP